jgi:hypothetical protein
VGAVVGAEVGELGAVVCATATIGLIRSQNIRLR